MPIPALPSRPRSSARAALAATVAVLGLSLTGCGDDAGTTTSTSGADQRTRSTTSSTRATTTTTDTATTATDADAADAVPLAREAIALGRRFEALTTAYAPVTSRVQFVVAADTLRRNAMTGGASAGTVAERTGTVRLEAQRLRVVLAKARGQVAAVPVTQPVAQHVQVELLHAIDRRRDALDRLDQLLAADSDTNVRDSERDALDGLFRDAWDDALRSARTATTEMQDARAAAGLDPAPEESLR